LVPLALQVLLTPQEQQALQVLQMLQGLLALQTLPVLPVPQERDWIVLRQASYKCNLNFTGLSVFVPLNTDGFARAFPCARVG
jgi:hypothetical protein